MPVTPLAVHDGGLAVNVEMDIAPVEVDWHDLSLAGESHDYFSDFGLDETGKIRYLQVH